MELDCPECGTTLEVEDVFGGDVDCSNCGTGLVCEYEEDYDGPTGFWLICRGE